MTSKVRNVIILVLVSISAVAGHKLGLFSTKLNLLSPANHTSIYPISTDNITEDFQINEDNIYLKCSVHFNAKDNYCAITILLNLSSG
ncbi:hypothetical protein [Paraglaciecola sp. L3A3]|uniref:hypothetical protein n=1 Tax=Paraglaciecola sp. L3A3 TaxID=2686358 RepID=UPI00131B8959|nr:hypothetical protein [Paraglaciecola sp. L3A3]